MTEFDEDDVGSITADSYFTMVPDWLLEHPALSDRSLRVWVTLMSYARNKHDRAAFPGRKTLAERCRCSPDSVDRSLRELKKAGALRVEPRWRADGSRSSSNYLLFTNQQGVAAQVRLPSRTAAAAGVRAKEEEPSTSQSRRTKSAPAKKQPEPLPADWAPNHTHRVLAQKLWLNLDALVEDFRSTAAAEERRTNWDRTFSAFLNDHDGVSPDHHWAAASEPQVQQTSTQRRPAAVSRRQRERDAALAAARAEAAALDAAAEAATRRELSA